MSPNGGRIRSRAIALACVLAVLLAAVAACTPAKGGSGSGYGAAPGGSSSAAAVVDTAKAVEAPIVAAEGGSIGLKTDEAVVRVTFPGEVLANDATIVATPLSTAPGQDDGTVIRGFQLEEKGTGAGPKMNGPAWIEMVVAKKLTDADSLVAYNADGTYKVLPTRIVSKNGVSSLLAFTTHFSGIGGRNVGSGKSKKARDKFSDFDGVVYINNTQKGQTGPIKQTVNLKLRAASVGGTITGSAGGYSGSGGANNTSSLPVKLDVQGTQVKLTVNGLSAGSMTFTGFVRGEGKK